MSRTIDKRNVTTKSVGDTILLKDVGMTGSAGRVATAGILQRVALVNLGIGVSQFDCNITLQFILEADRLDTRNGLDDCGLAVSDVTNGADINGRLTGNL